MQRNVIILKLHLFISNKISKARNFFLHFFLLPLINSTKWSMWTILQGCAYWILLMEYFDLLQFFFFLNNPLYLWTFVKKCMLSYLCRLVYVLKMSSHVCWSDASTACRALINKFVQIYLMEPDVLSIYLFRFFYSTRNLNFGFLSNTYGST